MEFDIIPTAYSIDGLVGYAPASTIINEPKQMPIMVRVNHYGHFDARNGGGFKADRSIAYIKNQSYHLRLAVDLKVKTYDVWVTPPEGIELQLAKDYAFRSDAALPQSIGTICIRTQDVPQQLFVKNHRIAVEQ